MVRCTTLLIALALLTMDGGTAEMPPVMIGIMASPMPAARKVNSHIMCSWVMSSVVRCSS